MRAIIYRDYGAPDVLELAERPRPEPASDEVLIRVAFAGVNPVDARLRAGEMKALLPGGFPRIPGYDVAGTVEQPDRNGRFATGDRVLAFLDHIDGGAYAEFATCGTHAMVRIPPEMPFDQAAALPLAGSTALQSLRDHARLQAEERVLINGASGGVGAFAVQIAKARGAEVTAVSRSEHNDVLRDLGADELIDYRSQDFTEMDRYWDVVFDASGKSSYTQARRVLARGGRYVSTEPGLRGLIISLLTWPLDKQGRVMLATSREKDLSELLQLWQSGQLRVIVDRTYPLEEAAAAHERLMNESFCGKLVLRIAGG